MIWVVFSLVVLLGGVAVHLRLRAVRRFRSRIDDEAIRRILEEGVLEYDGEDLDLEEIRRREEEFWEESWDEPEELF